MSDDELDTILTAESVHFTGKTLEGIFAPFSLRSVPPNAQVPYARAPYMLLSPVAGLFHGLGGAKAPFAIVSLLTIIILVSISWILWGERIAVYTAFVFAFNPWSVFFGRTAFDTPISVFFIYLFLLCLLTLKSWWLVLAIIPWFIGLYSYQGMIVIYPLMLIAGSVGIRAIRGSAYGKEYGVLVGLGLALFTVFMIAFAGDRSGTRMGEIALPNSPVIVSRVDDQRRKSVQTPVNGLLLNKYTETGWQILGQYIGAFSTEHLFVSGEARSTFSLWNHGLFYPVEFILLIAGLYTGYVRHRKKTVALATLMLIAPIPSAISTTGVSYALRSSLMYPLMGMFIAVGIANLCMAKRFQPMIKLILLAVYAVMIVNFLDVYFIRNPVNNSEGFGFSNRVLARYMELASASGRQVLYVGNDVVNTYRQYIFFSNSMTPGTIMGIQRSVRTHSYAIGTIRFLECPTDTPDALSKDTVITPYGKTCAALTEFKRSSDPVAIAHLGDSGRIFEIYNDTVCRGFPLSEYQPLISFSDLDVETLPAETFCKTYISKPVSVVHTETSDN